MTDLKGEQCSNLSVKVCAPAKRSFAPANLTLVNWSPTKGIFIEYIGSFLVDNTCVPGYKLVDLEDLEFEAYKGIH